MKFRREVLMILVVSAAIAVPIARAPAQTTEPPTILSPVNGIEILSPTGGADFTTFSRHLAESLRHKWLEKMPEIARMGYKGKVVVRFSVQTDGALSNDPLWIEVGSGKKELDDAAVAAIRASAPFDHLPESFNGSDVELRITFTYSLPPTRHP